MNAHTTGGPHRGAKLRDNGATGYRRHPRRPCHKRAIHSSPERSSADTHGQLRSSPTCAVPHPRRSQQRPIWLCKQGGMTSQSADHRSRRTTSRLVTWGHTGATPDRIPADNTGKQRSGIFTGQCLYRASCPGSHNRLTLSRTEEVRGSNPLTSTPNLAGQSVASVEPATLTAGCGRAAAASSSHSAAQRLSEASRPRLRPHTMTTQRGHHQLPPDGRSSRASSLSRSAWPSGNHLPRRRPSPSRPSAGPARPAPASSARLQPRADDALS